ncbi:MAG: hypothetical protein GKR88_20920 [Flavobacteriaceae bacterium]|nr:MAG: hypothetical protein GKR88_20920 [Flavobacteriaceae bacterium]
MKKTYTLALILMSFFGCFSPEGNNEVANLEIRISNISRFNYENIKVNASGETVYFGNLNSNSKSEYKTFDVAYRYVFVEFQIDGETFTLQPIDYVGETPLGNGKYSYEIDIDPNSQFQKVMLKLKHENLCRIKKALVF